MSDRRKRVPLVIREAPLPDPDPRPRLRVWRPVNHIPLIVVCVSDRLARFYTHWDRGTKRPVPCPGLYEDCERCQDAEAVRRVYYVVGMYPASGKLGLLELTAGAVEHCPELLDQARSLRGSELKVWRMKRDQSNAPERVTIGRGGDHRMPQCPDIGLALARYWGMPLETRVEGGGA